MAINQDIVYAILSLDTLTSLIHVSRVGNKGKSFCL